MRYLFCHSPASVSQCLDTGLGHHIWHYFSLLANAASISQTLPLFPVSVFPSSLFVPQDSCTCLLPALFWILSFPLGPLSLSNSLFHSSPCSTVCQACQGELVKPECVISPGFLALCFLKLLPQNGKIMGLQQWSCSHVKLLSACSFHTLTGPAVTSLERTQRTWSA